MTREEAIREVVRRLVDYYQPEKIYLIGSSARGEARPDSDLDFIVVIEDDPPKWKLPGGGVQQHLQGIPLPIDVVPFRKSVFKERSDWLMSLPAIALREGILQYDGTKAPTPGR
jgi:predicted nucleotidyltransferase